MQNSSRSIAILFYAPGAFSFASMKCYVDMGFTILSGKCFKTTMSCQGVIHCLASARFNVLVSTNRFSTEFAFPSVTMTPYCTWRVQFWCTSSGNYRKCDAWSLYETSRRHSSISFPVDLGCHDLFILWATKCLRCIWKTKSEVVSNDFMKAFDEVGYAILLSEPNSVMKHYHLFDEVNKKIFAWVIVLNEIIISSSDQLLMMRQ